ncbi:hypothetical protein E5288_WYG021390 [Bos mutus]|uniref:Uncharacterized protein n=1 Tax=Bos mutus TaxID=72004 RepID=A0A6B0RI24_9CETA|nr:hypothetical protein [Bos mutus]
MFHSAKFWLKVDMENYCSTCLSWDLLSPDIANKEALMAQESESSDAALRFLALNVVNMANVKDMTIGDLESNRVHFRQQTDKVNELQKVYTS